MEIRLDISALIASADEMGASEASFIYEGEINTEFEIDKDLQEGLEISVEDLVVDDGLLSIHGRQVLLYIADQGGNINEVIAGRKEGKKVHVADCKTLVEMKQKNKFGRYHVTNNVSGIYKVFGKDYHTKVEVKGEAELSVCKNCLTFLNYKNYALSSCPDKDKTYKGFSLGEFFSQYSTVFKQLPKQVGDPFAGYPTTWKDISNTYRANKNYCCEQCRVDLSKNKNLLHCHHISGNKQDNDDSNLMALCINCHRQQPMHQQIYISRANIQLLYKLRAQQGLVNAPSWDEAMAFSDTALHGILELYKSKNWSAPDQIGLDVADASGEVVAYADIAWTWDKCAIVLDHDEAKNLKGLGWNAFTIGEAFRNAKVA